MSRDSHQSAAGFRVDAVCLAALVGVSALLWLCVLKPHAARRAELRDAGAALADHRQLARRGAAHVRQLQRQLEQVNREIQHNNQTLQPLAQLNHRLDALTELTGDCGLQLNAVKTGRAAEHPHYRTVTVSIEGVGNYPRCAGFVHRLHEQTADFAVRALALRSAADGGETATFQMELLLYLAAPAPDDARVAAAPAGK